MCAAHAITDPKTGGPVCLGRLSPGSTLFDASGEWWIVGLGSNWPVERDDGAIDGSVPFLQAPELWSGAAPSPSGDYVALILYTRFLLPHLAMTGPIARILRGEVEPTDDELVECLRWADRHMIGEVPSLRPSVAEAVRVADRIRELAGHTADQAAFAAHAASVIRLHEEPSRLDGDAAAAPLTVTLGPDASWIAGPDGARYRLGRALRRITTALVERHRAGPESALTTLELLEAGWPGEQPIYEAGVARVYVAVNRLRRMGFRDAIERFDDGYRLTPSLMVRCPEHDATRP